jgi:hypothetical protein
MTVRSPRRFSADLYALAADASEDDELKPLQDDPHFAQIVAAA